MPSTRPLPPETLTWLAVLGFTALRAALLPAFGLMPQDAYYAFYAEHLSLSYLDHPPMIGIVLWSFFQVLGVSEIAVRLASWSTTIAAFAAFAAFARPFLPKTSWHRAVTLLALSDMVTVLSLIATPDVPLVLFWALSLWALRRAIFDGRVWAWPLAGLLMGLAFDSKYTGALLPLGLVLYLVLSRRHRFYLKTPWPYVSLVLAALTTAPVWIWNARHGWASFTYQTSFRTETLLSPSATNLLGLLATQMYLLTPPLFVLVVRLLWRHGRRIVRRRRLPGSRTLFLLVFFAPAFLGFFALTTIFWVKINWIVPAYLTAYVLAARFATPRLIKKALAWSIFLHLVLAVELVFYAVPVNGDDTWYGWRELAAAVAERAEEHPDAFLFSEDGYKTTAQLNFHLDRRVYGPEVIGDPRFHFRFAWEEGPESLVGRDALLIDSVRPQKDGGVVVPPREEVARHFGSCERLEPISIEHRGREVRRFRVYRCEDYLGPGELGFGAAP